MGEMRAGTQARGDPPGLGPVKAAIDPLLSWLPGWAHAVVWAVLVYAVLLTLLTVAVRKILPWLTEQLAEPATSLLDGIGALFVFPEYLLTSNMRRFNQPVPAAAFGYSEGVQVVTGVCQGARRILFGGFRQVGRTPKPLLALLLVIACLTWDGDYCAGRGPNCITPTTHWMSTVSLALASHSAAQTGHKCRRHGHHRHRRKSCRGS